MMISRSRWPVAMLATGAAALSLLGCGRSDEKAVSPPPRSVVESTAVEKPFRRIALQSQFSPLFIAGAPEGGGHPIGGPAYNFVAMANKALAPLGAEISFHVTGDMNNWDAERTLPPLAAFPSDFPNLHEAVAAGASGGGVDMGVGLANMNGHPFGQLLVASLPFGLEPDEFLGWLYAGGGLELQQELYDEKFGDNVIVLPVAITPTQGGGWFKDRLPDPDTDQSLSPTGAMANLCNRPIIVRWPEPGSRIWQTACANAGVETGFIGAEARCASTNTRCPTEDNPVVSDVKSLTFGGFIFGGLPHKLALLGHIDAYELNTAYTDVLMMKLATGQAEVANEDADLNDVIEAAPYLYGSTWHQPLSYVELLINRAFWDSLTGAQRSAITVSAQASVAQSLATMLDLQDEGVEILEENGAIVLRWPDGLLDLLRIAADQYLNEEAARLADMGDTSYALVLQAQREYLARHQKYNDMGDINQGRSGAPTSP